MKIEIEILTPKSNIVSEGEIAAMRVFTQRRLRHDIAEFLQDHIAYTEEEALETPHIITKAVLELPDKWRDAVLGPPETSGEYLLYDPSYGIVAGIYIDHESTFYSFGKELYRVTHWMPLPGIPV